MQESKLNLQRIAEITGFSKATVSRVLNGSNSVKPATRDTIMEAVKQMGYEKRNRSLSYALNLNVVTVFALDAIRIPDTFYQEILTHLTAEFASYSIEINLVLVSSTASDETLSRQVKQSEAIILLGVGERRIINEIERQGVACLLVNEIDPEMRTNSISPDYEFGAYSAAKYLANQGHRRVKLITSNVRHSIYQRVSGFTRGACNHGIDFQEYRDSIDLVQLAKQNKEFSNNLSDFYDGTCGPDFGLNLLIDTVVDKLLDSKATAVFCICDAMAITLVHSLKLRGIKVPEDISVIGFDGVIVGSLLSPSLTTISVDYKGIARYAVSKLIKISDRKDIIATRACMAVKIREGKSVKKLEAITTYRAIEEVKHSHY